MALVCTSLIIINVEPLCMCLLAICGSFAGFCFWLCHRTCGTSVPVVARLLSCVQLFDTPWTTACQASRPSPSPGICLKSCPVFLPGESHGQRSLAGHGPWGHRGSDTTEVASGSSSMPIESVMPSNRLIIVYS